jgi:soluble lytic murein transglycosylase
MLYVGAMHGRRSGAESTRTWTESLFLPALCATLAIGLAAPTAHAADAMLTAYLTPGSASPRESDLSPALAASEAERYRRIFRLQEGAEWAAADTEIARLRDRTLLGHVLAQRYLDKRYRRVGYAELEAWLADYAELPDAAAIHALAVKRRPARTAAPEKPVGAPVPYHGVAHGAVELRPVAKPAPLPLEPGDATRAAALRGELRLAAREHRPWAQHLLRDDETRALLSPGELDDARADLVEAAFFAGEDAEALTQAALVATEPYRPFAHWIAGLAAWRSTRLAEARSHFEALARTEGISPWNKSAAAYWASRVHLRAKRPQLVNYWLGLAAEHPRTFYGLLARKSLGHDIWFNFEAEPITRADAEAIEALPAGRRILALLQIDEGARAEQELRVLANRAGPALMPALTALADRGNMPAVSLQLAAMRGARDGRRHDHAAYPVPRWEPAGGFTVDRALLFALMRQESEFLADVESPAGALGLMQIMPATARAMAQKAGLALRPAKRGRTDPLLEKLREPETNLRLAQDYVLALLRHDAIKGNLVLLAAAYNSGPGTLAKWKAKPEFRDDPLLFLESIPNRETRAFAEHVLTSYWIYRQRFAQRTPDLDALASGGWPVYVALDPPTDRVTRNAAAR